VLPTSSVAENLTVITVLGVHEVEAHAAGVTVTEFTLSAYTIEMAPKAGIISDRMRIEITYAERGKECLRIRCKYTAALGLESVLCFPG